MFTKNYSLFFITIFFLIISFPLLLKPMQSPLQKQVGQLQKNLQNFTNTLAKLSSTLNKTKRALIEPVAKEFFGDDLQRAGAATLVGNYKGVSIYKVHVLFQNDLERNPHRKGLKYRIKNAQKLNFYRGYGCSFHALKNLIYLCKILLEQGSIENNIKHLNSADTFLHFFESPLEKPVNQTRWQNKWLKNVGVRPWYDIFHNFRITSKHWSSYRSNHYQELEKHGPPATEAVELRNLIDSILDGQAIAPDDSSLNFIDDIRAIQAINVFRLNHKSYKRVARKFTPEELNKSEDILAKVVKKLKKRKSLILPLLVANEHAEGRHWIVVIANKVQSEKGPNKIEVIYADSWLYDPRQGQLKSLQNKVRPIVDAIKE